MIIDFHTHTFPDSIATRAITKLKAAADMKNYTNGTTHALQRSMWENGIDVSVLLPVATKPTQCTDINRIAVETNDLFDHTHLLSFGSVHPDSEDYKAQVDFLAQNGVKGIKMHPVSCKVPVDDIRYKRIISYASENRLIITVHGDFDPGFAGNDCAHPKRIREMLDEVRPVKFVSAHMGGWGCMDEVKKYLVGQNLYFDTAYSIAPLRYADGTMEGVHPTFAHRDKEIYDASEFVDMVRSHGVEKILFGTDSPWGEQKENVDILNMSGLIDKELSMIFHKNAEKLLKLV